METSVLFHNMGKVANLNRDLSKSEPESSVTAESMRKAYRTMLLARTVEDKLATLYRAGQIKGGVYVGRGQEALSVALGQNLRPGDLYAPLIRDQAGRLAFNETPLDAFRTHLGSALGPMRGRDGNIHRGRPQQGALTMISHLGAMISVVNGALMARRFKGIEGMVGATTLGDGGTSTGAFHEGLNQAAVEKLPLVLVVANNQYAYSTPNSRQFACRRLVDKAIGYGIDGFEVSGVDLAQCLKVIGNAVHRARQGFGPQLIVAELLRLAGHGEHDDASYVCSDLKCSPMGRDCLDVARNQLQTDFGVSQSVLDEWKTAAIREVDAAVSQAQQEPTPDPLQETWQALSTTHLSESLFVS